MEEKRGGRQMKFCQQCDNMLYISLRPDERKDDKPLSLTYSCKHCGYFVTGDDIADEAKAAGREGGDAAVLSIDYTDDQTAYKQYATSYITHDPTLPRASHIVCPNAACTRAPEAPNEVIYIKYNQVQLKFMYYCTYCKTFWRTGGTLIKSRVGVGMKPQQQQQGADVVDVADVADATNVADAVDVADVVDAVDAVDVADALDAADAVDALDALDGADAVELLPDKPTQESKNKKPRQAKPTAEKRGEAAAAAAAAADSATTTQAAQAAQTPESPATAAKAKPAKTKAGKGRK
jgi:hypothetical protein